MSWWVAQYGLVEEAADPLARRAEAVFQRVAAAADKRANRLPRLAVLDAEGTPLAVALPDGTVVLTRDALRICYGSVSEPLGDARLAFVLGHELSHLGNDDFWHAAAFATVREHGAPARDLEAVLSIVQDSVQSVRKRELQADAYGMLYMTSAGYDPALLFQENAFFDEWSVELDRLGIRSASSHPSPGERSAALRAHMADVAHELDVFRFGVRLVQLGRFEDGLILLESFRGRFPGRENSNNIGFAELALALVYLGACDDELLYRFKLPLALDSETLAAKADALGRMPRTRGPGGTAPRCLESEFFGSHWREATRSFRIARDQDPTYVPARKNLISALLIAGRGTEALNESNEALEQSPADRELRMLHALALYLTGQENDVETADAALIALDELASAFPDDPAIAFNQGRLLTERRRFAAGVRAWRTFLTWESRGPYAEQARQWVSEPDSSPLVEPHPEERVLPSPPVHLGALVTDLGDLAADIHEVRVGRLNGTVVSWKGGKAYAIDDVIEIAEVAVGTEGLLGTRFGPPDRVQRGSTYEYWFYPGLMLELEAGVLTREIYFLENPRR